MWNVVECDPIVVRELLLGLQPWQSNPDSKCELYTVVVGWFRCGGAGPSLKGLFALWLDKLNKLASVVDIFVFPVVCQFDDTYLRDYFKFIIGDEDTYVVVRSCQVSDSDQQKTDTTDTVHHIKARCKIKENVVESNLVQVIDSAYASEAILIVTYFRREVMESVPTRVSTDRADMAVTITGAASLGLNAEPSPNNDTAAQSTTSMLTTVILDAIHTMAHAYSDNDSKDKQLIARRGEEIIIESTYAILEDSRFRCKWRTGTGHRSNIIQKAKERSYSIFHNRRQQAHRNKKACPWATNQWTCRATTVQVMLEHNSDGVSILAKVKRFKSVISELLNTYVFDGFEDVGLRYVGVTWNRPSGGFCICQPWASPMFIEVCRSVGMQRVFTGSGTENGLMSHGRNCSYLSLRMSLNNGAPNNESMEVNFEVLISSGKEDAEGLHGKNLEDDAKGEILGVQYLRGVNCVLNSDGKQARTMLL
ncbi:hypothetical protein Tco_0864706 [Tanacetum coccineum]